MSYYDPTIREGELIKKVADGWFKSFDTTRLIGDIDFAVAVPEVELFEEGKTDYLLWAEAKQGVKNDIYESFVQLILTIGKARTFDKHLPPPLLGAFDAEKIAFIPYTSVIDVFYENDFNWNVTPSDHKTKEFKQLMRLVENALSQNVRVYDFEKDGKELGRFIAENFRVGKGDVAKVQIDRKNFTYVYQRWLQEVGPSIKLDWTLAKRRNILPLDFYLADLLAKEDETIDEVLFVLLKKTAYKYDVRELASGEVNCFTVEFNDGQKAYRRFWNRYHRPPKKVFWDLIMERRDLLVPQDVRKVKGAFFTPPQWVRLSQRYIAKALGEDWQEKYYVWDCCGGTANLLVGLTNKDNIFVSTLDMQDVKVTKQRIKAGKLSVWENHVFQFDFLNDEFFDKVEEDGSVTKSKLPQELQAILKDEEKRKRLVMYINPPYAEASDMATTKGAKEGKRAVEQSKVNKKYASLLRQGNAEIFVQFFTRIYYEVPGCVLAEFSKLKILQGPHFEDFRNFFLARLCCMFIVPANTFDNVKGSFPVGFMVWKMDEKERFKEIEADVYRGKGEFVGKQKVREEREYINEWVKKYRGAKDSKSIIGKFPFKGNDFQNQNMIRIVHQNMDYNASAGQFLITKENVVVASVYYAVRKCIKATWKNDREQFLAPNKSWAKDFDFQSDCLAYTLFSNNIQEKYGRNEWIPFSEKEMGITSKFDSHFMSDFLQGRPVGDGLLQDGDECALPRPVAFTEKAQAVMDAGRELWKYYLAQKGVDINASLHGIRAYFKGRDAKGNVNRKSDDEVFTRLDETLKARLRELVEQIAPKVYEHRFLIE